MRAQGDVNSARSMRELPLVHTGKPAPFRLVAPAYLAALVGWLAAGALLTASADDVARLSISGSEPVSVAHAVGLVFFPFAVVAAAWQLIPVMLRNNPPRPQLRPLILVLLVAGVPLAYAVAHGRPTLAYLCAAALGAGLVLFLAELGALIRGAPRERRLAVSRPPLALAAASVVAAFSLGLGVMADGGPEPLGVPYERVLLAHIALALVGWLTMMIAAVGRTLVPMLGLASAAPPRAAPVAEIVLTAGLWIFIAGVASMVAALVALGCLAMLAALARPAARFVGVARSGRIGAREGPVLHVAVGLVFLVEAGVLGICAAAGAVGGRRAAVAGVLLLGLGWAAGVVVGHLGKLISLSGWGSWPPGPRPTQAALYPRRGWQVEALLFAVAVEVVALGVLADSRAATRAGAVLLTVSAVVALLSALETIRRVRGQGASTSLASSR
jgi:hypothetical protein